MESTVACQPVKCRVWMMIGIAGSDKSSWIQSHKDMFNEKMKIVSRDAIRFSLLKENESYFSKENEVFKEFIKQIKEGIEHDVDVIIDATHLNARSRAKVIHSLGDSLKNVEMRAVVITTDVEKAIERDSKREGRAHVGPSPISSMSTTFRKPTLDEGFDYIYYFDNNGKNFCCYNIEH